MNKYQEALKTIMDETCHIGEVGKPVKIIKELVDKTTLKQDEISLSKETFIELCRGEIGVMDITGQTLYELTGDIKDFDEWSDGE